MSIWEGTGIHTFWGRPLHLKQTGGWIVQKKASPGFPFFSNSRDLNEDQTIRSLQISEGQEQLWGQI